MKMTASSDIYLFADFRFDRASGGLFRRDGPTTFAPVKIGSRALDLLTVLIEQRGFVVSKDEIMAAVWPKMAVEEANLFFQISTLRNILDGQQRGKSCIQTVVGRGYRFIASVTRCTSMPVETVDPTHVGSAARRGDTGPPRLSIVVLPFVSIGDDPEQDYFTDGVTDSLTTDLSRISGTFVIGRSTAFTYKGQAGNLKQIGRDLNVRYVLEGRVQRVGSRMRVNVQLLEAESAGHIWAERFEKPVANLFDMQDEIVSRLANALGQELVHAEAKRAECATNPDSIDHYFLGQAMAQRGHTVAILDKARFHYDRALELEPDNVDALVARSWIDLELAGNWLSENRRERLISAEAYVEKALKLNPDSAAAHLALGFVQMYRKRAAQAIAEFERALAINRNCAIAHAFIGFAKLLLGRSDEIEAHVLEAFRFSPRDSTAWVWVLYVGLGQFYQGRDEGALERFNRSKELNPNSPVNRFCLAAALAHLDRLEEAREAARTCLQLNPSFTIARFRSQTNSDNPVYLAGRERMYEGLRKAGMPEG
jgi:TolB-like protein/Tfp pilus assembly protein PilF